MCLLGGFLGCLPVGFLAFCSWVILVEFPKRLQKADVKFIRASSFLVLRFRPGCEGRAPKKHISKNKDRDIPYKPPYNQAP